MTTGLETKTCVPCEGGVPPMTLAEATELHEQVPLWELNDNATRIRRCFTFDDFRSALGFVTKVGALAEIEAHHPDIELGWGRVEIILWTHSIRGLSENDFILAAKIDRLP